jgi:photosystem II stability/assembly factor-like uncharacterized protein
MGATGRVTSIAIDPVSPNIIYTGARGSGIWKTTDGGSTWAPIGDQLPSLNIEAIVIAPTNHNLVYIVTSSGIFSSADAGATWVQKNTSDLNIILNGLLVSPADPATLYLATANGVCISKTGGTAWILTLDFGSVSDIVLDKSNTGKLYAAISNPADISKAGIYETDNGGGTNADWKKLTGCSLGPLPIINDPATSIRLALSGDLLYASYKTSTDWTLYKTTGGLCREYRGQSQKAWKKCWSPSGSIGTDPIFRRLWNTIYADPTNPDYVYATGTEMWVSSDGGITFTRIPQSTTTTPHADYHAFAVYPSNTKTIFVGTDGGIFKSTNYGLDNWKLIGKGMSNAEFYSMATASTQANIVIGAAQDDGAYKYDGTGTSTWKQTGDELDREFAEISPVDNNVYYLIGQNTNQLYKSKNGGTNFSASISSNFPSNGFADPFPVYRNEQVLADPNNKDSVYLTSVNTRALWKGLPWRSIFTPPAGAGSVKCIAAQKGSDLLYAGTSSGYLYKSGNFQDFTQIFKNPQNAGFTDIVIGKKDQSLPVGDKISKASSIYFVSTDVFISFGGNNTGRIYYSPKGSLGYAFKDITFNLPAGLSVNTIAIDFKLPFTIYAGTSAGVYKGVSANNGATWLWSSYNNNLPGAVWVTDLQVQPVTGILRACTFGRGIYEINTNPPWEFHF